MGIGHEGHDLGGDILYFECSWEASGQRSEVFPFRWQGPSGGEAGILLENEAQVFQFLFEWGLKTVLDADPDWRAYLICGEETIPCGRVVIGKFKKGERICGEKAIRWRRLEQAEEAGAFLRFMGEEKAGFFVRWGWRCFGFGGRIRGGYQCGMAGGEIEAIGGGEDLFDRKVAGEFQPAFPTKPGKNGIGKKAAIAGSEMPVAVKFFSQKAVCGNSLADGVFGAGKDVEEDGVLPPGDLGRSFCRLHGVTIAGRSGFGNP